MDRIPRFSEILDTGQLQKLAEAHYLATGIPIGIIDVDGSILVATGWQEICTEFHRRHPASEHRCRQSDAFIQNNLRQGQWVEYKCLNGMWDIGLAIMIRDIHVATLFLGQFFYDDEEIDREFFRRQARECGFAEGRYLRALERVPVYSRARVKSIMEYNRLFVELLTDLGHRNLLFRQSEEEFRSIADYTFNWENWFQPDGRLRWVNPAVERHAGYSKSECLDMPDFPLALVVEQDRARMRSVFDEALEQRSVHEDVVFRLQHKSGDIRWMESTWLPVFNALGEYLGIRTSFRDITRRKKIEEEQARLEALSSLIEAMPDGLILLDPAGEIVVANKAFQEMTRLPPAELKGKMISDLAPRVFPATEMEEPLRWLGDALKGAESTAARFHLMAGDGTLVPVIATSSLLSRAEGSAGGIIVIFKDISALAAAEEAGQESREQFRRFVEGTDDLVTNVDSEGRFVYVNAASRHFFGLSPEECIGRYAFDFIHPEDKIPTIDAFTGWVQDRVATAACENRQVSRSGEIRDVYWVINPHYDRRGNLTSVWSIGHDISGRKMMERELEALNSELQRKNEELEQIMYVSSHDLRSPLVNIQGFGEELKFSCRKVSEILAGEDISPPGREALKTLLAADIPEALEYIRAGVEKMDTLSRGLLRLSRLGRGALAKAPLDMNALLSRVAATFEFQAREKGAQIVIGDMPACFADEAQLDQVFSNLIGNALNYLDPGRAGVITIDGKNEGDYVQFSVRDNGIGIAEDHQRRVFELFHRLHPGKTRGEGLGLTIVKRIIDRHGGQVWLESKPGQGTTFFVKLPCR